MHSLTLEFQIKFVVFHSFAFYYLCAAEHSVVNVLEAGLGYYDLAAGLGLAF